MHNSVSFIILTLQIATEWASGSFVIKAGDEDIHTANERRLKVGINLSGCRLLLTQPKRTFYSDSVPSSKNSGEKDQTYKI